MFAFLAIVLALLGLAQLVQGQPIFAVLLLVAAVVVVAGPPAGELGRPPRAGSRGRGAIRPASPRRRR
jgi:hypothetical protein